VNSLVSTVIYILSWIVGILSIIMVIYGGFRFVTSGGDAAATSSARNTIFYALIGLVLAVLATLLVHFVLNKAINATKTTSIILLSLSHISHF
jgi:ABC-type Fe3+ transport system permease subunit